MKHPSIALLKRLKEGLEQMGETLNRIEKGLEAQAKENKAA
ncbi:hypothetical protein [Microbulbifer okhotskensis]|nr:hypothetical protein [Microbulbifer okhotskensis]